MAEWTDAEWLTLQLGPVWIVSALVGRNHLDEQEQEAFWRAVEDAPVGDSATAWRLMQSVSNNREWLLDEFVLDDRSITSGLSAVTSLLERESAAASRATREAILRVGHALARARGPFGRRVNDSDAQILELLAQLMKSEAETAEDNPLNSQIAR